MSTQTAHSLREYPGFDLLRLIAATLVIVQHAYALTGIWHREWMVVLTGNQLTCGAFGVAIFFVISGFLVHGSLRRDGSVLHFLAARALRILPALIAVVVLAALVLGPIASTLPMRDYFAQRETWQYLSNIKLFPLYWELPGVFAGNPIAKSVNGSLWTLPYEVLCYGVLLLAALLLRRRAAWAFGVLAGGSYLLWLGLEYRSASLVSSMPDLPTGLAWKDLTYFMSLFFAGSLLSAWRDSPAFETRWAIGAAVLFVAAAVLGMAKPALPLALPLVACTLGQRMTWGAGLRRKLGDLSYGLYLWAFPIQQWLADPHWLNLRQPELHLVLSLLVLFPIAWASWHWVERPSLALKNKLR